MRERREEQARSCAHQHPVQELPPGRQPPEVRVAAVLAHHRTPFSLFGRYLQLFLLPQPRTYSSCLPITLLPLCFRPPAVLLLLFVLVHLPPQPLYLQSQCAHLRVNSIEHLLSSVHTMLHAHIAQVCGQESRAPCTMRSCEASG